MINILALSSLALAALHMAVAPASAHGYVNWPPSRQALCSEGRVPACGEVQREPDSVLAPQGSFSCNGDGQRFPELNNETLWQNDFSVLQGVDSLLFEWTITARHRTTTWEYFILDQNNNALLTSFNDHNAIPPATVYHRVPLNSYTGRQTILARWNIANAPIAWYSCVDLLINPTEPAMAVDAAATQLPIAVPLA